MLALFAAGTRQEGSCLGTAFSLLSPRNFCPELAELGRGKGCHILLFFFPFLILFSFAFLIKMLAVC